MSASQNISICVDGHTLFNFPRIYDGCISYEILKDTVHIVGFNL